MKQAFLKRFNPWADSRRQQQDAWNKFKFDMTKDDVDAFRCRHEDDGQYIRPQ